MKKTITLLTILLISLASFAQGRGINYKAVIKDDSGTILANQNLKVKFSILDSSDNPDYSETHTTTTDANGIVILIIGGGTENVTGDYFSINWANDLYKLNVEIDPEPYGVFINMGTTQFMAVPYAKQAESATFRTVNNVTSNSPGDLVNDNLVFGSTQMDDDNTTPNDNARLFFNKAKGAFRAGLVDDTYWNDSEVGSYSVSMGLNNKAKGQNSVAIGGNTSAIGFNAIAIGNLTQANNLTSVAIGAGAVANGRYSAAFNLNTTADALASTAFGRYNVGGGNPDSWIITDPLFEIGNSSDINNKTNALTVLKNGTIIAPSFDISEITDAKALITKEYLEANNSVSTGLEYLDETDNGFDDGGWRLVGRDPLKHGNIGIDAIDMSFQLDNSTTRGATGKNSIAMGDGTTASGEYSTAMGWSSRGFGAYSTAMGYGALASGNYTTSMGVITRATGESSTAVGYGSEASGHISTSFGYYTDSESYNSFAIGRYNIGGGYAGNPNNIESSSNWIPTDPLFEIGNGVTDNSRNNALTVLKNGKIGVNTSTPASLFEVAHGDVSPTFADRTNALSIRRISNGRSWQFYTQSDGYLLLFSDGNYRGSFNATSGAYVQASDRRVKKDITPLESGTLNKVMELNPVSYLMKDQRDTKRNLGLISQEVQEIFPSLTHYVEESDLLTLSYTELIPILIKAMQEQQDIIEAQSSQLKNQDTKIDGLTAELMELKTLDQRVKQLEQLIKKAQQ